MKKTLKDLISFQSKVSGHNLQLKLQLVTLPDPKRRDIIKEREKDQVRDS